MLIMYKILNPQIKHTHSLLDIPDPGRLVPRARNEEPAVSRKVERVDFLHVALEEVSDAFLLDVPDLGVSFVSGVRESGRAGKQ